MPSPPVLEIDPLLAPIPGDEPAGAAVALPLREQLDLARKDINPADFDDKDPNRVSEPKRAEWDKILATTQEILAGSSKDLMMAARLTEALTRTHGFAGLRDGVTLFRRLFEDAWEYLRPVIEEPDDLEARGAALNWLDDNDRGARFPLTIRQIPLVRGAKGAYSWTDWNLAKTGKGAASGDDFEQAILATPRADCQLVVDDIEETIAALQGLFEVLNRRMGNLAPSLTFVRQAVFECRTLAMQVLDRKGPAPAEASPEEAEGEAGEGAPAAGADGAPSADRVAATRAHIYRRLAEAADLLQKIEPHSPIPYLIRRAVSLGELPFPDLIKELVRDQAVIMELARNLGIKELNE